MSCGECSELGYPNNKKGFRCNLNGEIESGWNLPDFYRKDIVINSLENLYEHYVVYTSQQQENFLKKLPGSKPVKRDSFLDFITNKRIGICPRGIIRPSSIYWLELISYCDGEMGLTFPAPIAELPDMFFQALGIVRNEKADLRKEEDKHGPKKNSHSN